MIRSIFFLCICLFGISFTDHQIGKTVRYSSAVGGFYQEFSMAIDSSRHLTGVYEYYDHWDEKAKEFLDINLLYFSGNIGRDSVVQIVGGWPGTDQHLKGSLRFFRDGAKSKFEMNLNGEPEGYNAISFRKGVIRTLDTPKKWRAVRIVKADKARLFDRPDSSALRKGYLVKNNIVKVIAVFGGNWVQVEYNPPGNHSKSGTFWIDSQDLLGSDPTKW